MKNILISPSILNADFMHLEETCTSLCQSGADWLHCDVMDGHFVPNISFGTPIIQSIKQHIDVPLDVHLMISHPYKYIESFVRAGADIVTFHAESDDDIRDTAQAIKKMGAKVGVAVKPSTSVEAVLPCADIVDLILIMTVEPGFGGQHFIYDCLKKVATARELFPNKFVQVDGGIDATTGKLCVDTGADVLVAGTFILKSQNRKSAIEILKKA